MTPRDDLEQHLGDDINATGDVTLGEEERRVSADPTIGQTGVTIGGGASGGGPADDGDAATAERAADDEPEIGGLEAPLR